MGRTIITIQYRALLESLRIIQTVDLNQAKSSAIGEKHALELV